MSDNAEQLIAKYTKQVASYTRVLAWCTGILAASTVVLTVITGAIAYLTNQVTTNVSEQTKTIAGQLEEMRSAAKQTNRIIDEANRQANMVEASSRAWVRPTAAEFQSPLTKGTLSWIKIHYRNFGKLPAARFNREIRVDVKSTGIPTEVEERRVGDENVKSCFTTKLLDHGNVVTPGGGGNPNTDAYSQKDLSPTDVDDDFLNGRKYLLLSGCYTYSDGSRTRHEAFCFFYQKGKVPQASFANCNYGNDSD
jgi:hypothetical protein